MRASLFSLALLLPGVAAGVIYDQPDFARIFSRVVQGGEDTTTCTFRPGFVGCSDGRTITTTRASVVPCETSPGVWTYAPAGTACVSVRGLESWGANTTLIAQGADLTHASWTLTNQGTRTVVDGAYRICRPAEAASNLSGVNVAAPDTPGGVWRMSACIMQRVPGLAPTLRMLADGGQSFLVDAPASWGVVSAGRQRPDAGSAGVWVWPGTSTLGADECVDVKACWHVQASTPGRPCWAEDGAAPFTCEGDTHTISTEGWPTEEGEITVSFRPSVNSSWRPIVQTGGGCRIQLNNSVNATLALANCPSTASVTSGALIWEDREYRVTVRISAGVAKLFRDGVEVASGEIASIPWGATAALGGAGGNYLNGSIRSLSWRTP